MKTIFCLFLLCLCGYYAEGRRRLSTKAMGRKIWNELNKCINDTTDMMVIMDSSISVGLAAFNKGVTASQIAVIILNFLGPLSPAGSRVGLIEYSSTALTGLRFGFGDFGFPDVLPELAVGWDAGPQTQTALALWLAWIEFGFPSPSNQKFILLTTDGFATNSPIWGMPTEPAKKLEKLGVKTCVVAIGTPVNIKRIKKIATNGCILRFKTYKKYLAAMRAAGSHLPAYARRLIP